MTRNKGLKRLYFKIEIKKRGSFYHPLGCTPYFSKKGKILQSFWCLYNEYSPSTKIVHVTFKKSHPQNNYIPKPCSQPNERNIFFSRFMDFNFITLFKEQFFCSITINN